jgi:hypothetical protein
LGANASPNIMQDYSVHMLTGKARDGQSLTEVRDLLLGELNKLKLVILIMEW